MTKIPSHKKLMHRTSSAVAAVKNLLFSGVWKKFTWNNSHACAA